MDEAERANFENEVRGLCERGEMAKAAALVVRGYGPEIFGFLVATHASEQDASDVFSDFGLGLVSGLPGFAWRSSLRTWAYTIARHASARFRRDARRQGKRRRDGSSELDRVAAAVRTATLTFLRTRARSRLEQLRDALAPEDRELLVLRVDRGLAWNDLAAMLHEGDAPLDATALARESQRLRKRFQLLKERLHEAARREGLVP